MRGVEWPREKHATLNGRVVLEGQIGHQDNKLGRSRGSKQKRREPIYISGEDTRTNSQGWWVQVELGDGILMSNQVSVRTDVIDEG
jgi:hypothetical protein